MSSGLRSSARPSPARDGARRPKPAKEPMMAGQSPVLVSAVRTPIGRFLGALSSLTAPQLGAIAIREAVQRAGVPVDQIDEVIMGNVVSAGVAHTPPRQAGLHGGVPDDVPAVTINKVCGSGPKAG